MQVPVLHDDRNSFARQLFTPLPARYDRLAEILSFGQNGRWRRAMVGHLVEDGPASERVVLDVAAGTAGVSLQIASRTGARVIGVDLTEQMLRQGARNVAAAGATAAVPSSTPGPSSCRSPDASVDALTFTYLLRYVSRPAGHADRARQGRPARRDCGQPGVRSFRPSAFWRFWWRALHLARAAGRRPAHRRPRVV